MSNSKITDEKVNVYERVNPQTGQKSLQIGPDQIASPKLDANGKPTIEVYKQGAKS